MSLKKSFVKSRNSFKVTFELPFEVNPEGKEIRLLGQFNNWNWNEAPVLKKDKKAYKTVVELQAGSLYEYRYNVEQSNWLNDGVADTYSPTPYANVENCVVDLVATPAAKTVVKSKKITSKVSLTAVEGIGPKIAEILGKAEIVSFEDLANSKKSDLVKILKEAGKRYTMHDPSTWAKQAKLLAQGKNEELKLLQKKLKGGKVQKK